MRRRRMHGHLRRRSSCKPSPLKHKEGEGWAHDFKTDAEYHKDDSKKDTSKTSEAEVDIDYVKRQAELDKQPSIRQAPGSSRAKKDDEYSTMDKVQDALSVAGMSPGYGIVADGANFLISGVRGIGSLLSGDLESAKEHGVQALFSAGGAIPIAGQAITTANLGRRTKAVGDAMAGSMLGHTRAQKAVDAYDAGEGAVNIVKGGK
tara:strand:- start:128 stop:742 length:615 start_codon:yes stop_codon:yes gene_type:complete